MANAEPLEIKVPRGTIVRVNDHPVKLADSLYLRPGEPVAFALADHTIMPLPWDDDDGYPD
jgi:hypothetical protein